MKTTLVLCALLLLSLNLNAQIELLTAPHVTGFFGIPFGENQANAKQIMLKKPGCKFDSEQKGFLTFLDATVAGHKTLMISLMFINDQFFRGTAFFLPADLKNPFSLYNQIKDELTERYALPSAQSEYSTLDEIVTMGRPFLCNWAFPENVATRDSLAKRVIALSISRQRTVELSYTDGMILRKYKNKDQMKKEKNIREY